MNNTGKARSERFRERRRRGLITVSIDVSGDHRLALERMGLIDSGMDRDKDAIVWAVERFLDTAPAVQRIGDALYPASERPAAQEDVEAEEAPE